MIFGILVHLFFLMIFAVLFVVEYVFVLIDDILAETLCSVFMLFACFAIVIQLIVWALHIVELLWNLL